MLANVIMPSVYKRGKGAIKELGSFCRERARKVYIAIGEEGFPAAKDKIMNSLEMASVEVVDVEFYGGECTVENIDKMAKSCKEKGGELIIAVGGGKAIDTAKAASNNLRRPCITVPTIAATCAAIAPLTVVYNDKGIHVKSIFSDVCPVGVFVDSEIIAKAPSRWLYSGMGDTLAKWYELRATTSKIPTSSWTLGGITNGKICYEIINKFGAKAKQAVVNGEVTDELEYVIDAIIYYAAMSSILGGEKCRGAAAHAIFFGFTNIPAAHKKGHGFLVGFGNLCLLALEDRSKEEILKEIKLSKDCGIPTQLSEIAELGEDDLNKVAEVAANAPDMKNMPFVVTAQMVIDAMKIIDRLSKEN